MTQQEYQEKIIELQNKIVLLQEQAARLYDEYRTWSKESLLAKVGRTYRIHSLSLKSPKSELIYALTSSEVGSTIEHHQKSIKFYGSKVV